MFLCLVLLLHGSDIVGTISLGSVGICIFTTSSKSRDDCTWDWSHSTIPYRLGSRKFGWLDSANGNQQDISINENYLATLFATDIRPVMSSFRVVALESVDTWTGRWMSTSTVRHQIRVTSAAQCHIPAAILLLLFTLMYVMHVCSAHSGA